MLGSAAFRTGIAPGGALAPGWVKNELWRKARTVPSLDLRFADNKSLVDAVTGAQLVTFTRASSGTFVGSDGVIKTAATNEPRFDHNPTTGESLGLLVEEARTNLVLQSEDLSDSITWVRTNSSVTANAATAPDGTTTADKLIVNSGITSSAARITQTFVKAASAITYTHTIFAKTGESGTGTLQIIFTDTATTANSATSSFSTVSGTITTAASAQGTFANASSTITAFANGWYRCSLTVTTGTEISIQTRIFSRLPTTGNGTSGLLLWGAQLEAGAFPTSYIPTTTATVTRAADVASITGTAFSSWYRQDEGTVFVDNTNYGVSNTRIASFSDNSTNNRFTVARGTGLSGNINTTVTVSGVAQVNSLVLASSLSFGSAAKAAVAIKALDFAGSANGLAPVTQATGSTPTTLSQITIGNGETLGANTFTGTIRRLAYWPTRLATLQAISQP